MCPILITADVYTSFHICWLSELIHLFSFQETYNEEELKMNNNTLRTKDIVFSSDFYRIWKHEIDIIISTFGSFGMLNHGNNQNLSLCLQK